MQRSANIVGEGLVCALLAAMILAVFAQTYRFDFVDYDDATYLTDNPYVRTGLSADNVEWAFTTRQASNFFPLTWLSHMLDFQLFGPNPGAHHLVNLAFHALNAILLFLILTRMTGALWPSAFVAGLFAVHPLHVESVAWISARKDLVSTLFWLLATAVYVAYVRRPRLWRYALVAGLLVLGLMAKTMLVTLPATLLLLDYWPLGRLQAALRERLGRKSLLKLALEKLPLAGIVAAFTVVGILALDTERRIVSPFPLAARCGNALVVYVRYILLTVWPHDLTVLNPHPGTALPVGQAIAAGVFLAGVSLWVVMTRRRQPYLIVGWCWYVGTLVPVIGIVQLHSQALAYRYTYVPLIGLFIMAAWGLPDLAARCRIPKLLLRTAMAAVMVALMFAAGAQTRYWRDGVTLFQHALDVTPDNPEAHLALGNALAHKRELALAISHYAEALDTKAAPSKSVVLDALNNWGSVLYARALGREGVQAERLLAEACEKYQTALLIDPDDAHALYNWGNVLFTQAQTHGGAEADRLFTEAYAKYQAALGSQPQYIEALNNWGNALATQAMTKDGAEADRLFAQAYEVYQAALRIKSGLPDILFNWGNTVLDQAQTKTGADADRLFSETYEKYRAALQLRPDYREVYGGWGYALSVQAKAKTGEERERLLHRAEACFLKAEELQPGSRSYSIAQIKALHNEPQACLTWLERAQRYGNLPSRGYLEIDPDLENVRDTPWFKLFLATRE